MNIKKGDNVKILKGKDRGKTGKVIRVDSQRNLVTVEGLNIFKRHQKPKKAGQKGEIVEFAKPIHRSNVMHLDEVARRKGAKAKSARK